MRIGIDLGGTKTEAVALGNRGQILERRRRPSPQGDYQATLETIRDLVVGLERDLKRRGTVGVGIPGAISPASGMVKNANSTWLIGQPLTEDISEVLERPVRIENDANCFALSEASDGAGADAQCVFGVILGTGVGGGLVIEGKVLVGINAIAGEWGHTPLPWPLDEERPGPTCYCGRQGCLETFLSGPGLARDHLAISGEPLAPAELVARAAASDSAAEATLVRYEGRLARALACVINLVDPDVVVLGGGLSNMARLYDRVPGLLPPYVFSDQVATRIVPPMYGDSSGVRGAAWLWPPEAVPP
ncbi:MAG: ROK family protein [Pseudomonadota bacterium]